MNPQTNLDLAVIDYSPVYFELLRKTSIPAQRGGKFVVLNDGQRRFAVFAPRELITYHANIVERFLWQRQIRGTYNAKGDVFHFAAPEWQVEGGGHWQLDEAQAVLRLFGQSTTYGSVDLPALAEALLRAQAFGGARIVAG